jgi:hypothetical protein
VEVRNPEPGQEQTQDGSPEQEERAEETRPRPNIAGEGRIQQS